MADPVLEIINVDGVGALEINFGKQSISDCWSKNKPTFLIWFNSGVLERVRSSSLDHEQGSVTKRASYINKQERGSGHNLNQVSTSFSAFSFANTPPETSPIRLFYFLISTS